MKNLIIRNETNGDYQVSVEIEGSKEDLKIACREAMEILYQEEWNIEVRVAEENQDGTWNIEIIDIDEVE
ncbi:MAG: hypothetical protein KKA19_02995 [Candidatus Margulisbacteria bacterium]|nr:hypothetical protein [Candidatus Margulisiibacteriota bacterium]